MDEVTKLQQREKEKADLLFEKFRNKKQNMQQFIMDSQIIFTVANDEAF